MPIALAAVLLAFLPAAPAPNAPLPSSPAGIARALSTTDAALHQAIDAWQAGGPAALSAATPDEVTLWGLREQRLYRRLRANAALATSTLPLLPRPLRAEARDIVVAGQELLALAADTPPNPHPPQADAGAAGRRAAGVLRRGPAPLRHPLAGAGRGQPGRERLRPAAEHEQRGRAGPDAVPARRPGRATASAATSTTRTTRSSARPTTCAPAAGEPTCAARSSTTTRRPATSTRCSATPGSSSATPTRTWRCTPGRSTSAPRRAPAG